MLGNLLILAVVVVSFGMVAWRQQQAADEKRLRRIRVRTDREMPFAPRED